MAALRAGTLYFAIMFLIGFVLGTLRVLWLVPAIGEARAVLLEVPLMLILSWLVAARVIRRVRVAATVPARAVMGGSAFALLMGAELFLSLTLFGLSAQEWLHRFADPAGLTGLAGQAVFGLIPVIQLRTEPA